jgi:hypothetical protein
MANGVLTCLEVRANAVIVFVKPPEVYPSTQISRYLGACRLANWKASFAVISRTMVSHLPSRVFNGV